MSKVCDGCGFNGDLEGCMGANCIWHENWSFGAMKEEIEMLRTKHGIEIKKQGGLYLSGPMTGLPDENRPAFNEAARRLREKGFEVVNPAELPAGWSWERYMQRAMEDLVPCEAVALLPGSWKSKGARMEIAAAMLMNKVIMSVDDWCLTGSNWCIECGKTQAVAMGRCEACNQAVSGVRS